MTRPRIFLLSPAHCGGRRAELLSRQEAAFPLAQRLREPEGAPIGEVFSFLSGLYFRGKMSYARAFSAPPPGAPGSLVITTDRGLVSSATRVTLPDIAAFARVPVDLRDPRYRGPLTRSVQRLAAEIPAPTAVVLLGSIATSKYLKLLVEELGRRVHVPEPFIGIGDMKRGALMLRAAENGEELPYVSAVDAAGAARGGARRERPGDR
jgi:hypothetical protein